MTMIFFFRGERLAWMVHTKAAGTHVGTIRVLLEPSAELAVVIIDRIVHTIFVFIRPKSNNCPALSIRHQDAD